MVAAWKKERRILYISGRIMYVIGEFSCAKLFLHRRTEEYFKNPNKSTDINGGRKMAPCRFAF